MTYGIVIASYKYGHLAAHCIETILCQTLQFDKIWFVDDGAGDCDHLIDMYPQVNFRIRRENLGIINNFNSMLNHVTTDYVMFIGADNWLRPDALARLNAYVEADNSDIVCYDIMVTGTLRKEISKAYPVSFKQGDYYWSRKGGHHGSMLYRTDLAKQVGGYAHNKTSERTDEDLNLWNKMLSAGAKISHIDESLLYYRRHENNFNKY